jgi:hypothetical protein
MKDAVSLCSTTAKAQSAATSIFGLPACSSGSPKRPGKGPIVPADIASRPAQPKRRTARPFLDQLTHPLCPPTLVRYGLAVVSPYLEGQART